MNLNSHCANILFLLIQKVDESLKGSNDVFFLRQVDDLDDACCTIAMVHTFANCLEKLTIGSANKLF